jgi:hypothetical protein
LEESFLMRRGGAAESLVTGVIASSISFGLGDAVDEVGLGLRRLASGDDGADIFDCLGEEIAKWTAIETRAGKRDEAR